MELRQRIYNKGRFADVELYAFCDISESRLHHMGEKYGIKRLYTDKNVMLKELPELDAVSVCTWNSAHAPCTIAALKAAPLNSFTICFALLFFVGFSIAYFDDFHSEAA